MSAVENDPKIATAEENLAAVRALSEGRAERRILKTVPFRVNAPVPRAREAWEDAQVICHTLKKKIHRQDLKGKLALFKRTKPGIFPAVDFAAFSGLKPGTISSGLGKYAARGLLRSEGKTGRQILWRFA